MNTRRLPIILLLASVAISAHAGKTKSKPDTATLLIGQWQVTRADNDLPVGSTIRFSKNGKMTITRNADGKEETAEAVYTVKGDKLQFTLKRGDRQEKKEPVSIKTLSQHELVFEEANNSTLTLTRKAPEAASPPAQTPLPHVELGIGQPARHWQGKTFAQILPASKVKRIVRIGDTVITNNRILTTGDFDALLQHAYASKEAARPQWLGQNEGTLARLAVFTTDGSVILLEIVSPGDGPSPSGLLLDDPNQSARIPITGFQFPETPE